MNTVIQPFLWFNQQAEEAVDFYLSVFPNSRRTQALTAGEDGPWKPGALITQAFEIAGQQFIAFNGGPQHQFNEAISFSVPCQDQAEIDRYWSALLAGGGSEIACGWLKDRFGVRWQIVPHHIAQLLSHPKAMQAMMHMMKFDIAALEAAARES